jgi:eukaryotic-like serine/threonine-protein kinase
VHSTDDTSSSSPSAATDEEPRRTTDPATDAFDPRELVGQVVAERYRIIEPLGSGGMGTVYRAEHIHMRKSVAFKVLHRELTHLPEVVARFEREAIAAARITHPNVATATDFGRMPDGACYLVLEYVHGQSLRQALAQSGPFNEGRTCRIARQIALALAAAHEAGIVHRDLKPENVMLVDGLPDADSIKVLDFGIAKIHMPEQSEQPALTRMGTIFGTPEYMSPEQALGQTADARTDLYSLGIIAYEMLTGRTPFADKELLAVLTRQMTEAPAPLPAGVDPAVAALVNQLLAKRPGERPQTAQEIANRFDALQGNPIELRLSDTERVELFSELAATAESGHSELDIAAASNVKHVRATVRPSLPAWLRHTLRVGARRIPVVIVVLVSLATMVLTLLIVSVLSWVRPYGGTVTVSSTTPSSTIVSSTPAPVKKPSPPDPLLKQARLGDATAIHAIESRPPADLDAEHWAALGRGRARNREWLGVLEAYGHALDKAPGLANDGELLSDIHGATLDANASVRALRFAAERLESTGMDIIYDVWSGAASGRASQSDARAARKLLDDPQLRSLASKSLRTALELSDARGCADYRRLLPKVTSDGDDRCLRVLRRLSYDRGCGLFGLGDCYSCLRGTNALPLAIEAAKSRPGPVFR